MPGTFYEDRETEDLLGYAAELQERAEAYDQGAKDLRLTLREVVIELRSRHLGVRHIGKRVGLSSNRIQSLSKGDARVYGPEYAAEQAEAAARRRDVDRDAEVREP